MFLRQYYRLIPQSRLSQESAILVDLARLSSYSQVLIISEMAIITEIGEERVLGLALASLGLTATGIVGEGENLREDYFR